MNRRAFLAAAVTATGSLPALAAGAKGLCVAIVDEAGLLAMMGGAAG